MAKREIKIVHAEDQVRVMFGAGDEYWFLATGSDTDGEYFLVEAIVPPGGGLPPLMQTPEEEAFYILEGSSPFTARMLKFRPGPGTYLNIPKGAKHSFRNKTDQVAKMLRFFAPAGIEKLFDKFEKMDEPQGGLEAANKGMNDLGKQYGVQ